MTMKMFSSSMMTPWVLMMLSCLSSAQMSISFCKLTKLLPIARALFITFTATCFGCPSFGFFTSATTTFANDPVPRTSLFLRTRSAREKSRKETGTVSGAGPRRVGDAGLGGTGSACFAAVACTSGVTSTLFGDGGTSVSGMSSNLGFTLPTAKGLLKSSKSSSLASSAATGAATPSRFAAQSSTFASLLRLT